MSQTSSTPKPKQASIVAFFNKTPTTQAPSSLTADINKITPTAKETAGDVGAMLAAKQQLLQQPPLSVPAKTAEKEKVVKPPLPAKAPTQSPVRSKQPPVIIDVTGSEKENTPAPTKHDFVASDASLPRVLVSGNLFTEGSPVHEPACSAPSSVPEPAKALMEESAAVPVPATVSETANDPVLEENPAVVKRKRVSKPKQPVAGEPHTLAEEALNSGAVKDATTASDGTSTADPATSAPEKVRSKPKVKEAQQSVVMEVEDSVEIPPAVAAKIESLREKMGLAVAELVDLEK